VRSAFARRGAGAPAMLPAIVSEMNLRYCQKAFVEAKEQVEEVVEADSGVGELSIASAGSAEFGSVLGRASLRPLG
jgi:hypothetical protein